MSGDSRQCCGSPGTSWESTPGIRDENGSADHTPGEEFTLWVWGGASGEGAFQSSLCTHLPIRTFRLISIINSLLKIHYYHYYYYCYWCWNIVQQH